MRLEIHKLSVSILASVLLPKLMLNTRVIVPKLESTVFSREPVAGEYQRSLGYLGLCFWEDQEGRIMAQVDRGKDWDLRGHGCGR